MKYTEKVASKLNELLQKNYDAEAGYKLAKDKVESTRMKKFFEEQAQERYNFGHELKNEIRNYGETPEKGTSIKGDAHRTWMNIKSTFSLNNEESILEEAVRGEKAAVAEYNSILNDVSLPPSTNSLLIKHRDNVQQSLNKVNAMESIA